MKEFEAELHTYYAVFQLSLNCLLLLYIDFLFRVDFFYLSSIFFRHTRAYWCRSGCKNHEKYSKSTYTAFNSWLHAVSKFIDLVPFHLICQMLAKFFGWNPIGSYLSLEKENVTSRFFYFEFLFYFSLVSLCREVQPLKEIWLL